MLFPHVIDRRHVVCNDNEHTYTRHNPSHGHFACTLSGAMMSMALHVSFGYSVALSFSLFAKLYDPKQRNMIPRWATHLLLWLFGLSLTSGILIWDGYAGEMTLGVCTTGVVKRNALLYLMLVPTACCLLVSGVLLVGIFVLLRRHVAYNKQHSGKV